MNQAEELALADMSRSDIMENPDRLFLVDRRFFPKYNAAACLGRHAQTLRRLGVPVSSESLSQDDPARIWRGHRQRSRPESRVAAELLLASGDALLRGDCNAAAEAATAALKAQPGAFAHALRGEAYRRRNMLRESALDLARALRHDPECAGFWIMGARVAAQMNSALRVVNALERAVFLHPDAHQYFILLIQDQNRQPDATSEDERLKSALERLWARDGIWWAGMLLSLRNFGGAAAPEQARKRLKDVLGKKPHSAWLTAQYARYSEGGGTSQALAAIDAACGLSPECGWIRTWRGYLWMRNGRSSDGYRELEEGLKIQPDYAYARTWSAQWRHSNGDARGAWLEIERSLLTDPSYGHTFLVLSALQREKGDWIGAVKTMTRCALLNPAEAVRFLGPNAARREIERAQEGLSRLLHELPTEAFVRYWRMDCLARLGRREQARMDFLAFQAALSRADVSRQKELAFLTDRAKSWLSA